MSVSVGPQEYPDIVHPETDIAPPVPFEPYIPAATELRELTPIPVIMGTILGAIFGASSLYLVLKVGLTVSASIPVAVISITLFRILSKMGLRDATILENNVVQTAGSAGESIAFGVGVTMPAILILGFNLEFTRVMLVAVLGGLLGILMMIPLRRALIVAQHGLLKYPEGTACAEVLKAGASEESRAAASESAKREMEALGGATTSAKTIFTGLGIGLIYKTLMDPQGLRFWKNTPERVFGPPFDAGSISAEISPELLGVGYIIGPRIGSIMCAGGVLAYLVLIPAIKYFGAGLTTPLAPENTALIKDMSPGAIRNAYVLYIGAASGTDALDRLGDEALGIERGRDDREPHRSAAQRTRPSVSRSAAVPRPRRSAARLRWMSRHSGQEQQRHTARHDDRIVPIPAASAASAVPGAPAASARRASLTCNAAFSRRKSAGKPRPCRRAIASTSAMRLKLPVTVLLSGTKSTCRSQ